MTGEAVADLLAEGRSLRIGDEGFASSIEAAPEASTVYRQAAAYDRVIGNGAYLRAVWSVTPGEFDAFARKALAHDPGPFLDAGCGTAVFTGDAYSGSERRIVLTDLSTAMLRRAAERIPAKRDSMLQADLFDLPFELGSFPTVACFGVLHCIDDLDGALAALERQVAPGGCLFVSSLVTATRRSTGMVRMLHRVGEFAQPRSEADFRAAVEARFASVAVERRGSMVYATADLTPA